MFASLSEKLEAVFKKLRGHGKLSEDNIKEAMRDVRRALLEADVNYKVAKEFVDKVTQKAMGAEVVKSVSPGQQMVKIVNDELVALLGGVAREPELKGPSPQKIMMVGLQGSGKTTMSAKLALYYRKKGRRPLLVAADVYRPAATDQLKILGAAIDVPVFAGDGKDPVHICAEGVEFAKREFLDLVIFDTAGRLHIDSEMMEEVSRIAGEQAPNEIFFAADAMAGQDAVTAAAEFNARLSLTGIVLTKLDGDARGGAALSVLSVTGKPIRFAGVGEKTDQLELFHPDRMASRILGMGDIVGLVEKAQESVDIEEAQKLQKKLARSQFGLDDFRQQILQVKKMGSVADLLEKIPGMSGKINTGDVDDKALDRTVAIINSMTRKERDKPLVLNGSRRKRIAKGSGTSVTEVNRLIKQFFEMQKMFKRLRAGGGRMGGLMSGLRMPAAPFLGTR